MGAVWGKLYRYNNLPEFSFTEMDVKIQDSVAVTPKTITVDQLGANINAYVKIMNAEFVSTENKNITFKVGDVTLPVYNQFNVNVDTLEAGTKYTIIGMGSVYKDNCQLNLISFENASSNINTIQANRYSGAIYNLKGQRVQTMTRGLYIRDGKKIIVK